MSIFRPDMKVIHKETKKIGTIVRAYNDLEVAIVNFEAEDIVDKVTYDRLGVWVDVNANEDKGNSEPGSKVITIEEFLEAVDFVCQPENMLSGKVHDRVDDKEKLIAIGFQTMMFGMIISREIYGDSHEIEVTREKLDALIVDNCTPTKLSKLINQPIDGQLFVTAMLQTIVLKEIVPYFFGKADND